MCKQKVTQDCATQFQPYMFLGQLASDCEQASLKAQLPASGQQLFLPWCPQAKTLVLYLLPLRQPSGSGYWLLHGLHDLNYSNAEIFEALLFEVNYDFPHFQNGSENTI